MEYKLRNEIEQETCPFCGSKNLKYSQRFDDDTETFEYKVLCNQCGNMFYEQYILTFNDQFIGKDFNISAKENAGETVRED